MSFLADPKNKFLRNQQCPAKIGLSVDLAGVGPVDKITTSHSPAGFITGDQDWYSEIMEGMLVAQDGCLSGKTASCQAIVDLAQRWAESDSLRPGFKFGQPKFEDSSWIGNILLRSTMISYGIARQVVDVPAQDEATIVDWLKRRVDDFHYVVSPSGRDAIDDPNNGQTNNHALAHMMAAFVFGILVGDHTMMEPGIERWQMVLSSMRDDGSLPTETRRGARWFHYSNIEIGQLITMAELAAGQGIDLYAMAPSEQQTIPHAVSFLIDALADFDIAKPYSKTNQGSPSDDYTIPYFKEFHMGWLPTYVAHYGYDENIERMRAATIDPRLCSDQAQSEHKTEDSVCEGFKGEPLRLTLSLAKLHMDPLAHMGYSAGCLQATRVSIFAK